MFTLMCDIFIMCFALFLFLTYFGLNFNVMADAAAADAAAAAAAEEDDEESGGGAGGGGGGGKRRLRRSLWV